MDFLLLLCCYLIVFILISLCLLYRDAEVLNSGPLGVLKDYVVETCSRLMPKIFLTGVTKCCNYLLYTRNCVFQVLYLVLVLLAHAVWVLDMIPILQHHYPNHNLTFWPLAAVFTNYFFWHKAWTGDPGEVTPHNQEKYIQVYEYDDILYIKDDKCRTCQFTKPARSKHCSICNRCVHRFDHHCIWTNNCVGVYSHRYFILFMVSLMAMFTQGLYVGSGCVLHYAEDIKLMTASYRDSDGNIQPITYSIAFQHLFMALPRLVFLLVAIAVLMVLVGIFLGQHLYLILTNQTTNERYKVGELLHHHSFRTIPEKDHDKTETTHKAGRSRKKTASQRKVDEHINNDTRDILEKVQNKYRPYSRGIVNNFIEVFLPDQFISSRIKRR